LNRNGVSVVVVGFARQPVFHDPGSVRVALAL